MNMSYSQSGIDLTKHFEDCKLKAYRDGGGVLTIGYGHTRHVQAGDVITQDQADKFLLADVADAADAVNDYVTVDLTQNQFNSLVDFAFNCGVGAFKGSTLLKLLNAGQIEAACAQLARWNQDNGVVVAGLTRRRQAEQVLFNLVA